MEAQKRQNIKEKFIKMKQLLKYLESCNKLLIQVSYNNDGSKGYILAFAIDDYKSIIFMAVHYQKKMIIIWDLILFGKCF